MNTIEQALDAITHGRMVVVMDDEDRENEGDLILAAEFATPEAIAFGLSIVERVPLTTQPTGENEPYLRTKQRLLGHALGIDVRVEPV